MKPVIGFLRSLGIRMVVYLDNMLMLGREEILKWWSIVFDLLGFLIHYDKSEPEPGLLGVPDEHCDNGDQITKGESQSSSSRGLHQASARQLAHLIGVSLPAILPSITEAFRT